MNQRFPLCSTLLKYSLLAGVTLTSGTNLRAQTIPDMPIMGDNKVATAGLKVPEYEVTSVKENKSEEHMIRVMGKPDGYSAMNISLKSVIAQAYGIKPDLISGGDSWISSKGFDIDAKVASADVDALKKLTGEQRRSMLIPVLADRFKLKVHTETKLLPIYELVVAKGGAKLTESAPVPPPDPDAPKPDPAKMDFSKMSRMPGMMRMGPGELTAYGITLETLASNLSNSVHRTVRDMTGLKAKYDITLKFAPEDGSPASTDNSLPSIYTAVQEQLGLRLQASKGDVQTLVIDHAEMPTEN